MRDDWRPVAGWDGLYEVTSDGRVRGAKRQGTSGAELSPIQTNGYHKVCLYRGRSRRSVWVHRLVLEAHAGPAPDGMIACHANGIRSDNRIENLRWDTPAENYNDARRHGTAAIGAKNAQTKLGPTERKRIFEMRRGGVFQRDIAARFGVRQQTISAVLQEFPHA